MPKAYVYILGDISKEKVLDLVENTQQIDKKISKVGKNLTATNDIVLAKSE